MTTAIRATVTVAAFALLAGVVALPAVRAADDMKMPSTQPSTQPAAAVNKKCPVSGDDIDPKVTSTYDGKTYAFCCADCVKSFQKEPAKYAAKAK